MCLCHRLPYGRIEICVLLLLLLLSVLSYFIVVVVGHVVTLTRGRVLTPLLYYTVITFGCQVGGNRQPYPDCGAISYLRGNSQSLLSDDNGVERCQQNND